MDIPLLFSFLQSNTKHLFAVINKQSFIQMICLKEPSTYLAYHKYITLRLTSTSILVSFFLHDCCLQKKIILIRRSCLNDLQACIVDFVGREVCKGFRSSNSVEDSPVKFIGENIHSKKCLTLRPSDSPFCEECKRMQKSLYTKKKIDKMTDEGEVVENDPVEEKQLKLALKNAVGKNIHLLYLLSRYEENELCSLVMAATRKGVLRDDMFLVKMMKLQLKLMVLENPPQAKVWKTEEFSLLVRFATQIRHWGRKTGFYAVRGPCGWSYEGNVWVWRGYLLLPSLSTMVRTSSTFSIPPGFNDIVPLIIFEHILEKNLCSPITINTSNDELYVCKSSVVNKKSMLWPFIYLTLLFKKKAGVSVGKVEYGIEGTRELVHFNNFMVSKKKKNRVSFETVSGSLNSTVNQNWEKESMAKTILQFTVHVSGYDKGGTFVNLVIPAWYFPLLTFTGSRFSVIYTQILARLYKTASEYNFEMRVDFDAHDGHSAPRDFALNGNSFNLDLVTNKTIPIANGELPYLVLNPIKVNNVKKMSENFGPHMSAKKMFIPFFNNFIVMLNDPSHLYAKRARNILFRMGDLKIKINKIWYEIKKSDLDDILLKEKNVNIRISGLSWSDLDMKNSRKKMNVKPARKIFKKDVIDALKFYKKSPGTIKFLQLFHDCYRLSTVKYNITQTAAQKYFIPQFSRVIKELQQWRSNIKVDKMKLRANFLPSVFYKDLISDLRGRRHLVAKKVLLQNVPFSFRYCNTEDDENLISKARAGNNSTITVFSYQYRLGDLLIMNDVNVKQMKSYDYHNNLPRMNLSLKKKIKKLKVETEQNLKKIKQKHYFWPTMDSNWNKYLKVDEYQKQRMKYIFGAIVYHTTKYSESKNYDKIYQTIATKGKDNKFVPTKYFFEYCLKMWATFDYNISKNKVVKGNKFFPELFNWFSKESTSMYKNFIIQTVDIDNNLRRKFYLIFLKKFLDFLLWEFMKKGNIAEEKFKQNFRANPDSY